jgi:hypothetical protein
MEADMGDRNKLEHLEDGSIAFHDEGGRRWRHRDVAEAVTGPGYRLFAADDGEERRYHFSEKESHDSTIHDLRDQLQRAQSADAAAPAEWATG